MKCLIIVAHPDDEAIIAGGFIAKAQADFKVYFATKNEQGRGLKVTQEEKVKSTIKEAEKSGKLGNFSPEFLGFEDATLADHKSELLKNIISIIHKNKPDIIITHHKDDNHIDHRTLAEIVPEASQQSCCGTFGFKGLSKKPLVICANINLEGKFDLGNIVVALKKEHLEKKIKMISCYADLASNHNSEGARIEDLIRARAVIAGAVINETYGEAYTILSFPLDQGILKNISKII